MAAAGADKRIVEPMADMLTKRAKVAEMMAPEGGKSAACRILLIEDDVPVRDRLAELISRWPGGQLVAACGKLVDGMVVIRDEVVDLLITDLTLPDGHGVQAIRMLRTKQPAAEAM